MNEPLNFTTDAERQKWIINSANYFTVIRRLNFKYLRLEVGSLPLAELCAEAVIKADPTARLLIYAVSEFQSTFVKYVRSAQL
jgi:hypothetical protein